MRALPQRSAGVRSRFPGRLSSKRLSGGDGNDLLVANNAGSTLWGGRGDDTLKGGAGADILLAGSGNNVVDGGGGTDTMRLDGAYQKWTIAASSSKVDLTSFTAAAKNSAVNVERFVFDDYTLAFDAQGTAGQSYRLFDAAFDRAPDLKGLAFWISKLDAGVGLRQIAEGFVNSNEFKTLYANAASNETYVQALYKNVQGRAPTLRPDLLDREAHQRCCR